MKKSFVTGLVFLLPLAVTIIVGLFFLHLLTNPFMHVTQSLLNYYTDVPPAWLRVTSQVIILLTLIFITFLLGILARIYLFKTLVHYTNVMLSRIPLINKIYKTCNDVVKTVVSPQSNSFMQVVLVPFPQGHVKSFGFVTGDAITLETEKSTSDLVSVFIPATPNPTVGFMVLFPRDQVTFLETSAEDALKIVVSAGLIFADIEKSVKG